MSGSSSDEHDRLRHQLDRGDARDAAQALLEPGEQLREFGPVSEAYGEPGPISDRQPMTVKTAGWLDRVWAAGTRTLARKLAFFTLLAPVALLAALAGMGSSGTLTDRLIGGRTCGGPVGSTARQVQHALAVLVGGGANQIVVTDRRVLFARNPILTTRPDLTLVLSVPRQEVAAACRRPRHILRRRVAVSFRDDSWIILSIPVLQGLRPSRLVAALTG